MIIVTIWVGQISKISYGQSIRVTIRLDANGGHNYTSALIQHWSMVIALTSYILCAKYIE